MLTNFYPIYNLIFSVNTFIGVAILPIRCKMSGKELKWDMPIIFSLIRLKIGYHSN